MTQRSVVSRHITGELIVLGTGTSVGVPSIGCGCEVCTSDNPKNRRTRCSLILGLPKGNLLVDTSPDVRQQLLREGIGLVHSVLYTHEHADHLFGLDDMRLMQFYLAGPLPLYCEPRVERRIRHSFDYAFEPRPNLHPGAVPKLEFHRIGPVEDGFGAFDLLGAKITPIRLKHGPNFDTLGFRFGGIAYCTDVNEIPSASMDELRDLDVLILDALRPEGHSTHFSLAEAIEIAQELKPKQTYFTHMAHSLEHEATNAALPRGMELAYDGLRIPLAEIRAE